MTLERPCIACHELADPSELCEVVEVRTGAVFLVHRPGNRPCFGHKVLGADVHRIVKRVER